MMFSDHNVVLWNLDVLKEDMIRKSMKYRKSNHIDIDNFVRDIENTYFG